MFVDFPLAPIWVCREIGVIPCGFGHVMFMAWLFYGSFGGGALPEMKPVMTEGFVIYDYYGGKKMRLSVIIRITYYSSLLCSIIYFIFMTKMTKKRVKV